MSDAVLQISDLVVRYGQLEALKGVDVTYEGGALGLLGPNGAGKSSLIRAILGLVPPSRGRVGVLGMDASRFGLRVRARVGYMPENDCHIPGLTGLEFTTYSGRISGLSARDAKRRAHEVLVYVGLDEERYRSVDGYSRGMRQKVKFASAIVHDPEILFLDEPTNGLDPQARVELLGLVDDLAHNKSMNIILSSHLLHDVESVCDDVIVLVDGAVRSEGRIADLKSVKGGFVVRVAGDSSLFESHAVEQGLIVESDGRGGLLVTASEGVSISSRLLFEVGRASGVPLRHLVPAEESLEEHFLRAVNEGS